MITRCTNPKQKNWKYYGGKGIKVCDAWLNSFSTFLADMGPRPDGMTIDRLDSNKDYEPSNCRWATRFEQQHNKPKKTHCPNGHPLEGENCYIKPQDGYRQCKSCKAERAKRYAEDKREQ